MANRGGGTAGLSPIHSVIVGFVALLTIIIIVVLGPIMAGAMAAATPSSYTCTYYNSTEARLFYGKCGTVNATDATGKYVTAQVGTINWNPEYNSAIPSGSAMWSTNVVIGATVMLIFFISLAIYYLRVIA